MPETGHDPDDDDLTTPRRPTHTPVGSPERIAVYRQRLDSGERLHHPDDDNTTSAFDLPIDFEPDEDDDP